MGDEESVRREKKRRVSLDGLIFPQRVAYSESIELRPMLPPCGSSEYYTLIPASHRCVSLHLTSAEHSSQSYPVS